MARTYFENLPSTNTPLRAERFNGLLNGEESIEKIVAGSIEGKNLFDKDDVTKNILISAEGVANSNNDWNLANAYIKVEPSSKITISSVTSSYMQFRIYEYGNNKSWVQRQELNVKQGTVTLSANTYYVRIGFLNTANATNIQVEKGSTVTDYVPFKKYGYNSEESMGNIVVDDIQPNNLISINASTTTINGITFTVDNKSITINGTATAQTDFTVDYVDLIQNQQYYLSGANGASSTTWFLNIQGVGSDNGNGFIYTPSQNENKRIFIRVLNGVTVNNAICTPMLNKGSSANSFDNSESEVYSTNEIKIGRWIDGKPLYRKVIIGTCASAINTTLTLGNISNLKDVAEINANWKANDNYRYFMSNPSESPVVYINASGDVNENHKGTYFNSVSIIITIKYTKTTD